MKRFYPYRVYELLFAQVPDHLVVTDVQIGLTWTNVQLSNQSRGLSMTLGQSSRTLQWSGSLVGKTAQELGRWILSWNPFEATIGQAVLNAVINGSNAHIAQAATPIGSGNLAVFDFFLPHLENQKIAVIGRYPGLEKYETSHRLHVIERTPGPNDYPDPASEYLLPDMDWVFLSASSLSNKTFPRLAELCADPAVVLMGPSVPWLPQLTQFNIDFLAGTSIRDTAQLSQTIAEGGGTKIFDSALEYQVIDLRQEEMCSLREQIKKTCLEKEHLKQELMEGRLFGPGLRQLERVDDQLAGLDARYRTLWNTRQAFPQWAPSATPRKANRLSPTEASAS